RRPHLQPEPCHAVVLAEGIETRSDQGPLARLPAPAIYWPNLIGAGPLTFWPMRSQRATNLSGGRSLRRALFLWAQYLPKPWWTKKNPPKRVALGRLKTGARHPASPASLGNGQRLYYE